MEKTYPQKNEEDYFPDGYISPIPLLIPEQVQAYMKILEEAESKIGTLYYNNKIHTILHFPYEVTKLPGILDLVEAILGPNFLLYNISFNIKEPEVSSYVSWYQDLTNCGMSCDEQVSARWPSLQPQKKAGVFR